MYTKGSARIVLYSCWYSFIVQAPYYKRQNSLDRQFKRCCALHMGHKMYTSVQLQKYVYHAEVQRWRHQSRGGRFEVRSCKAWSAYVCCSAGRLESTMASREAVTLAATVGQHLDFGEVNVSADSATIRKVIEAIFWGLSDTSHVASSTQMQREPLMAVLLETCKGWIADGYCIAIGHIFAGRLFLNDGINQADTVPKASMRPHQDKAQ